MPATPAEIAQGVAHLSVSIANVYFVGSPGGPWVLIDSSLPGYTNKIRQAAEALFGPGTRPEAILLTHGHYDHVGSALQLANLWDVPIYVHPLELPNLTGRSEYPPLDPTAPGFMAFLTRFIPSRATNISGRVRPLERATNLRACQAGSGITRRGTLPGRWHFSAPATPH